MLCEAEIVGWGIVDPEEKVVVIVHGQDFGGRPCEHPPVVEPELILNKFGDVFGALLNSTEDVWALGTGKSGDFGCL